MGGSQGPLWQRGRAQSSTDSLYMSAQKAAQHVVRMGEASSLFFGLFYFSEKLGQGGERPEHGSKLLFSSLRFALVLHESEKIS